ncbi:Prolipoprotein diacylglyceryl transferase [Candidatus Terasakiella magnetica]|uniref:Phosphatidylglycerol--prolipoprotein diacylglyceryl transferase n=1 Tax=Candidatus Terasakiella magnetica TaxID=1867952 RepID=A0A1C3RIE5_9PROT|nr:prolipoprotein diacylglyceryl transferase [Candidatus Terasakiella magnetica]SCA57040.1 Prolipoprotein diacylglyceryl transferase [Candidatus Terasakiella magnetica]
MTFAIAFPMIDPVAVQLGPIAIRWYALAYIVGLVGGWHYIKYLTKKFPGNITHEHVDDFLFWATIGVVIGGRLGYVLFYNLDYFAANPGAILQVWKGGMSFHGGFLGVVVAAILFCKKHKLPMMTFGDLIACGAPIGLFFGRIANFANSELYGRETDVAWGVIFPNGGPNPRHPSQLYEAAMEGLILFIIMFIISRRETLRHSSGLFIGLFIAGYGIARSIVETVRQPDAHIGYLSGGSTMGQWLSIPMILIGIALMVMALRKNKEEA